MTHGMREATCVILAAGLGRRLSGKLALPFRGGTILDAVLDASGEYPVVLVASTSIAVGIGTIERLVVAENEITVVVNDDPERGMAHSLRLANREIAPDRCIAVLLGDKPLVSAALIRRLLEAEEADVVFPVRDGIPGHPVVFSPNARALIEALPDGDTLQRLRDDPSLIRNAVSIDDDGAYVDVDTEEDYRGLLP
ncbi:MAG: nucleotidyltransferase family protein [Vulcanimicrobiaceae bacterium]